MDFKNTKEYIYEKCVRRVESKRLSLSPVPPQIALCPTDKSLVSCFFNRKLTQNNKYLVTSRLLDHYESASGTRTGAVPAFGFNDIHEVLWGSLEEFDQNLFDIFSAIIKDLIQSDYEHLALIDVTLCDHITYSKYSTFYRIKKERKISLLKYFAIYDVDVSPQNMDTYLELAINYLYHKKDFAISFQNIFLPFTQKYPNYTHFDQRMEKEFLPKLLSLFEKYKPRSSSLGLRVKTLIETDLIKSIEQIDSINQEQLQNPEFKLNKMIIHSTSQYITELERIANQMDAFNTYTFDW